MPKPDTDMIRGTLDMLILKVLDVSLDQFKADVQNVVFEALGPPGAGILVQADGTTPITSPARRQPRVIC